MAKSVYIAILPMVLAILVSGIDDSCPYQKCDCYADIIHCDFSEFKKLPPLHSVNVTRPLALLLNGNSLATIPVGALPSMLTSIDFEDNPIKTIDKDAFNGSADTLTELLFDNSLFTEIPDALLRLNNLTHLTIGNMKITTWDDNVMKHIGSTLQALTLTNVGMNSWPTWIQYQSHLGTLELSKASIVVPDNGFDNQVNTLFSLNLENGILTEIPSAVTKLIQLQHLELDSNNISKVTGIPGSPVLTTLSMGDNKISDSAQLSDSLLSVSGSLTELFLSNNQLTHLPDLSAMDMLESVYLTHNSISYTGTSEISSSLKYLDIGQNNLQSIDSFMRNGLSLMNLMIPYNSIKEILGVDIPASLQQMDISFNLLTELSDESFPSNSSLQTLTLDSNPIAKVSPKAFLGLSNLTYLSMAFTKITRLPLSLTYLTSAVTLELSGNDDMICTCTEKEIRPWLQLYHVGILGQCGVTSIDNFLNVMSEQCPD